MIVSIASIQARARNAAATGAAAGTAACPYIEGTDAAALFHKELQAELARIQTAQQHFRFIEFNNCRAARSAPARSIVSTVVHDDGRRSRCAATRAAHSGSRSGSAG